MAESGFFGGLPSPVLPGLATTQYQLVEVGPVRAQQANHLEPEALVYFSPLQHGARATPDTERIQQHIPMQLATMLVPGTVWSASGELLDEGSDTYTGRRQLVLGKQAPDVGRLADLFPLETSRPGFLQAACPDAWYAIIKGHKEQLLVPCFELLRAFCYQGAGGLSNFLFSRLPLDALCWPIAAPSTSTAFTAHLCVAAASLGGQEAIVLAELLFNSPYRASIEQAHRYLATTWHACEANREIPQAFAKVYLQLGRNVEASAWGVPFAVGKQHYFWVSRLLPSPAWHSFKAVVYHPLGAGTRNASPFSALPHPAFRNMLQGRRPTPKTLPAAGVPEGFRQFGRGGHDALLPAAYIPVTQDFPWAARLLISRPPVFADPKVVDTLWARPGYALVGEADPLPANLLFQQACTHLQQRGCLVNVLEINNPGRHLGPGRSLFPYACAPNRMTHLPDGRYRPLSIAHVQWGGGHFYLLNVLDSPEFVLCYQKNLTRASSKALTALLLAAVKLNVQWNLLTRRPQYRDSHEVIVFELELGIAWLSESIHVGLKHAVAYYNQAVEFFRQIENLDLTEAASDTEQLKLIDGVRHSTGKIQYPGNQIGESSIRLE